MARCQPHRKASISSTRGGSRTRGLLPCRCRFLSNRIWIMILWRIYSRWTVLRAVSCLRKVSLQRSLANRSHRASILAKMLSECRNRQAWPSRSTTSGNATLRTMNHSTRHKWRVSLRAKSKRRQVLPGKILSTSHQSQEWLSLARFLTRAKWHHQRWQGSGAAWADSARRHQAWKTTARTFTIRLALATWSCLKLTFRGNTRQLLPP